MSLAVSANSPYDNSSYGELRDAFQQRRAADPTAGPGVDSTRARPDERAGRPALDPAGRSQPAAGQPGQPLSAAEQAEVEKLKARDREVRAHEQAHQAAGAGLITRGASYSYKSGPDGQQYAVGGEVGIDTSPVRGNPAATIRKAERIRRAALAPAEPSPQDRAVAAEASRMAADARRQQAQQAYTTSPAAPTSTFQISA
ncbi:MAG: hypothetical protein JNK29_04865 [Anaerolineales bacterium]|nr:hypothetical protein [Anaerolineales bacterium]